MFYTRARAVALVYFLACYFIAGTRLQLRTVGLDQNLILTCVLDVGRAVDHELWSGAVMLHCLLTLVTLDLEATPCREGKRTTSAAAAETTHIHIYIYDCFWLQALFLQLLLLFLLLLHVDLRLCGLTV